MSESLIYKLAQVPASVENVATVIRDDINGSTIMVAAQGVAVQLKVKDLVNYINTLEAAKMPASSQETGE